MGTLVEVEVKFRARFLGGKGQMRARLVRKSGGSTLFGFDLPPDGVWRDISFKYQLERAGDDRSLLIETLPYKGKLQIDDVWAGEPGTHVSVRPMVATTTPVKPATPAPAPPVPVVMPVVPAPAPPPAVAPAAPPAASSANYSLDQVLDALPASIRAKLMTNELPPATVDEVNAALAAEIKGKPLQVTFVVHTSEVVLADSSKYRLRAADGMLSGKYPAVRNQWFWAYLPSAEATEIAKVDVGQTITLEGKVSRCDLKPTSMGLKLNVDMQDSHLVAAKAAGETAELRLNDSEWKWGSGGILKLQKGGVATHTAWKAPGSWKLAADNSLSLQRPGNDPPMTVVFSTPQLTQGSVTSHTGSQTTLTRIK
jgi:hypothetical protein